MQQQPQQQYYYPAYGQYNYASAPVYNYSHPMYGYGHNNAAYANYIYSNQAGYYPNLQQAYYPYGLNYSNYAALAQPQPHVQYLPPQIVGHPPKQLPPAQRQQHKDQQPSSSNNNKSDDNKVKVEVDGVEYEIIELTKEDAYKYKHDQRYDQKYFSAEGDAPEADEDQKSETKKESTYEDNYSYSRHTESGRDNKPQYEQQQQQQQHRADDRYYENAPKRTIEAF